MLILQTTKSELLDQTSRPKLKTSQNNVFKRMQEFSLDIIGVCCSAAGSLNMISSQQALIIFMATGLKIPLL